MENTTPDNSTSAVPSSEQVAPSIATTSLSTSPVQPQTAVVKPGNSYKKMIMFAILGVLALIVGAMSYYILFFESPAKIGSSAEEVNGEFIKYSRTVKRLSQHLEEEPGSSADELERYAAEGEDLMREARDVRTDLDKTLRDTKVSKLKNYLLNINDYTKKADELSKFEEENIKMGKALVKPLKMYEDLTIELSGASNYMISDPKRYTQSVTSGVTKLKEIIRLFQQVEAGEPFDEYYSYTVSGLNIEVKYLESLVKAVEDRDADALAASSQVYAQEMQKNGSDGSRASDKVDREIKELGRKLEELKEDVAAEYSNLKSEYKF